MATPTECTRARQTPRRKRERRATRKVSSRLLPTSSRATRCSAAELLCERSSMLARWRPGGRPRLRVPALMRSPTWARPVRRRRTVRRASAPRGSARRALSKGGPAPEPTTATSAWAFDAMRRTRANRSRSQAAERHAPRVRRSWRGARSAPNSPAAQTAAAVPRIAWATRAARTISAVSASDAAAESARSSDRRAARSVPDGLAAPGVTCTPRCGPSVNLQCSRSRRAVAVSDVSRRSATFGSRSAATNAACARRLYASTRV